LNAHVGHVDVCHRIIREDIDHLAGGRARKRAAGKKRGKRTFKASYVQNLDHYRGWGIHGVIG
jgi:hypothetical protein